MAKVLGIVGTRPQLLKVDPLLCDVIVNTGQHYDDDMAGQHLRQRKIKPKYNLGIDSENIGKMIDAIRDVIKRESPEIVVVYGDTYSTAAGALAASWEGVPVAHVEAGLRCGDMSVPEEINRIIADRLSSWRFCPTALAMNNLLNESLGDNTHMVGDPLFDSLKEVLPTKKTKDYQKFILVTVHRRENLQKENLTNIIGALGKSGERVIFPMHPHTRRILKKFNIKIPKNIEVIKPVGRKEMVKLTTNAKKVVTDSGGLQREAYWFLVPSVLLREACEWMEIVEDGYSIMTGANELRILEALSVPHPHRAIRYLPKYGANEKIRRILHV